jgi:hypothetical protein
MMAKTISYTIADNASSAAAVATATAINESTPANHRAAAKAHEAAAKAHAEYFAAAVDDPNNNDEMVVEHRLLAARQHVLAGETYRVVIQWIIRTAEEAESRAATLSYHESLKEAQEAMNACGAIPGQDFTHMEVQQWIEGSGWIGCGPCLQGV